MDYLSDQVTQKLALPVTQSENVISDGANDDITSEAPAAIYDISTSVHTIPTTMRKPTWRQWYDTLKKVLPTYIIVHLVFLVITCLSVLFTIKDFSKQAISLPTLWNTWLHWDTINFRAISVEGYTQLSRTAFFPLYPLLERIVAFFTPNSLIAGILISDVAGLGMLIILFRLVEEDFNTEYAYRTILYLSIFPTAFFFAAGYSESLFLFLTLLSFYYMRRGQWWRAGLVGFFIALTRAAGVTLLIPLFYEYIRQHMGKRQVSPLNILRSLRFDILSALCIPAGIGLYAFYCYTLFHDPLAFSHAEAGDGRHLTLPGYAILRTVHAILISPGFFSFLSLRNTLDLIPELFLLALVTLAFIGPWKFSSQRRVYAIYAATFYLFPQFFPFAGLYPLASLPRYLLATFPAFIVLAAMGKKRTVDTGYFMISAALLCFLLTQFLLGHWIT